MKTALKNVAITTLTAAVLFSGWCIHQYTITGRPKPFYGMGLWLASAAIERTGGRVTNSQLPEYASVYRELATRTFPNETQRRLWELDALEQKAKALIMANPAAYLKLGFTRMKRILWTNQSAISWSKKSSRHPFTEAQRQFFSILRLISTHSWRVILCLSPLAVLGLQGEDKKKRDLLLILIGFSVIWMLFHYLLSVAAERYGFQIVPFIFLLTTTGLYSLYQLFSRWTLNQVKHAG